MLKIVWRTQEKMPEKIKYKLKYILLYLLLVIGKRQFYRRIALTICKTLQICGKEPNITHKNISFNSAYENNNDDLIMCLIYHMRLFHFIVNIKIMILIMYLKIICSAITMNKQVYHCLTAL